MAYTRETEGGVLSVNIQKKADGTFNWRVVERFKDATVDTKTGAQAGQLILATGEGVADYDTAAAAAKSAFDAAG
tara:strand:+ start:166 stop:390 length:225 start_codon:yes stop_codon:yes gene_type:complete